MDKTDISFLCGAIPGGIGRFRRAQPTHCGGGSVPRYGRGSLPDGYSGYKGKKRRPVAVAFASEQYAVFLKCQQIVRARTDVRDRTFRTPQTAAGRHVRASGGAGSADEFPPERRVGQQFSGA